MSFSIIAAISSNNVIGKDNKLPWNIPEDLEYFHSVINGKTIIMGRKTYDSIGRAIKNSKNIVISRNNSLKLQDCFVEHSLDSIDNTEEEEVMIIGGSSVYEKFLPLVDKMYLTLIHSVIDGDAYFPEWSLEDWSVISKRDSKDDRYSYSFFVLQRELC